MCVQFSANELNSTNLISMEVNDDDQIISINTKWNLKEKFFYWFLKQNIIGKSNS